MPIPILAGASIAIVVGLVIFGVEVLRIMSYDHSKRTAAIAVGTIGVLDSIELVLLYVISHPN